MSFPSNSILAAICAAVLSSPSRAQTACFTNLGPDVIVGDMPGSTNYAPAGGIEAFSVGATLCNLGTVALGFAASTNQHPVLGSGLYRLKRVAGANRFEQVGMSWLHHGFFALNGSLCCSCTPTDGTTLGVGCSDPSTAARQGSQAGLGPRWQVNAHTGAFPYPPANPAWSGSVARRLQVPIADLEVTGASDAARYFVEKLVIAPDEAAAGNANNNAAWREVSTSVSSGNWTFALTGGVHRESPAIRAWRDLDPGVLQVDLQVPGEGLFLLGCQATDLGGGAWHYEYAICNLNSDWSAQSFSMLLPASVTPANIGFHDVAYHDGDGIGNIDASGVDWTVALSAGALSWSSETFAQNPNANALRWGTLYNFRFDADAPPTPGTVTLGFFKSPGSISASAHVPAGTTGTIFCSGDGSGTACPCGNFGSPGHGCANSVDPLGAALRAVGAASLGSDTLDLRGTAMPNSSVLYFQGTSQQGGGAGVVFGDGLRCAGGSVIRLGTKSNVAGSSHYPEPGDPPVSQRGLVPGPESRTYQCWYRNAALFCTSATFNLSNGLSITWSV